MYTQIYFELILNTVKGESSVFSVFWMKALTINQDLDTYKHLPIKLEKTCNLLLAIAWTHSKKLP